MFDKAPYLSVVIPAYNEKANFKKGVLEQVNTYLKQREYSFEVIVVDDGSTDATADLVEKWIVGKGNWKLIRKPHKGKAPAVTAGIKEAIGEIIVFTDFDQATPISEIEKLLPFMKKGYSIAIGSREVKGSRREEEPWHRHLMGRGWNIIVQIVALRGIHDTQCGFKLFKADSAKKLFDGLYVYKDAIEKEAYTGAFDVELLYLAQKKGLQIAEVPVHWKHIDTDRVNPIRDSVRMFIDLLKIRLADVMGKYEK